MLRAASNADATTHAIEKLTAACIAHRGIFAINKPPGISSAAVLHYFKRNIGLTTACLPFPAYFEREQKLRIAGTKIWRRLCARQLRVGHGGTLDVEASGVLVVGVNRGCKLLGTYLSGQKVYVAESALGVATESRDAEGRITGVGDASGVRGDALARVKGGFLGRVEQRPPVFSALKVEGKRMYEYARRGVDVPKPVVARTVVIDNIEITYFENPSLGERSGQRVALPEPVRKYFSSGRYAWSAADCVGDAQVPRVMQRGALMEKFVNDPALARFQMVVQSGGGMYVRSLVHDMGEAIGCGATMLSLVRLSQGPMRLGRDTIDVEDLPYVDRVIDAMRHADSVINKSGFVLRAH
ncbi:pseudouridine synthase pus4 [Coemansia erecta]|nr:pseudouridine synthase pus4 [Coemansia erecta]